VAAFDGKYGCRLEPRQLVDSDHGKEMHSDSPIDDCQIIVLSQSTTSSYPASVEDDEEGALAHKEKGTGMKESVRSLPPEDEKVVF
jgi:hypothetical protein